MDHWLPPTELVMVMSGIDAPDEFMELLRTNRSRLLEVLDVAELPDEDTRIHHWVGLLLPGGEAQEGAAYILWNTTVEGITPGYRGRGHQLYLRLRQFLLREQIPCREVHLRMTNREIGLKATVEEHLGPAHEWLAAVWESDHDA